MKAPVPNPIATPRLPWADLGLALSCGLLLNTLLALQGSFPAVLPLAALRLLLSLAFLLFIPGYLLQSVLFPRRRDLACPERLGLSIGLSIAIIPPLALFLDRLPCGLRPWPVAAAQGCLVLLLMLAVLWRRWAVGPASAFYPRLTFHPVECWRSLPAPDRRLFILAAASILFSLLALAWAFLIPSRADFFTEFYLLGKGGLAQDYPAWARVGQPLAATAGIRNLERSPHSYRLEAWAVDRSVGKRQLVASAGPFPLERGASLEMPIIWSMPFPGEDLQVEFLLYLDTQPEPYRRLRLWLNVAG